ncbi:MAG: asparaginase [Defluviitaleaceae bacterium]|nr:asparaginase [Defluviitaleaceae bacterium]
MALIAKEFRGKIEDLHHYGHIVVVDTEGNILRQVGNPYQMVYSRSSAKPMQAIPVIESGAADKYKITDNELAVMCASHTGEKFHEEAVLSILKKIGLDEGYLQCGTHRPFTNLVADKFITESRKWGNIHNNCSGSHAGMLATALIQQEDLNTYCDITHPVQKRVVDTIANMCSYPADKIVIGIDGCGVPVHALPLYKFAQGYAKMSDKTNAGKAVKRITKAMTSYPEMVGGTEDFTSELMQAFGDKMFCKYGSNAFFAIGLVDKGIGIAMKIESGRADVIPLIVLELLVQINEITEEESDNLPSFKQDTLKIRRNHRGEEASRIVTTF